MATLRETFKNIADAIREKGVSGSFKPTEMAGKIGEIQTGGTPELTNIKAAFAFDDSTSLVVPNTLVLATDFTTSTNLYRCFSNCGALTSITFPAGFGQNAENIEKCFSECGALTSITLPAGFGQNATTLQNCFENCRRLKTISFPTGFGQNATNLNGMFSQCTVLTSLTFPAGFGQNATNISFCFSACYDLKSLTLPAGFGQNATNLQNCFYSCDNLTDITGNPNFKDNVDLQYSKNLTHESIMLVINGLQTVTSTKKLKLGSQNLAKLTEEEKQIAIDKGWTLA